ncbi:MAG: hypothetical protein ACJAS4_001282 [Bacteriovoracaceae bacterium]|jgi:hypothetical protein
MRNKEEVFLLFRFSHNPPGENDESHGRYQIIFFFDYNGEIDFKEFKAENSSFGQGHEGAIFGTKEELTEFAQDFVVSNSYKSLYLLSANDFNIGIESCHDLQAFREIFKRYGHQIENKSETTRSLFGRIF